IRAAISLLEKEGFLESVQGRGVFVKEISFQAFYEMFEMLVSMQVYALDIAGRRGLSFDIGALKTHLDLQVRAAEEEDYSSYYENSLLFVKTMIAVVRNQSMLQAFEQIKGKYLFKIVSHRKLNADTLPKPKQAKDAHARIYEALLRGDLEAAKTAVDEINDMLYRHIHLIDI